MKKTQVAKNIYADSKINTVVYAINTSDISPNPSQPRAEFDTNAISKLADSIKQYGLLQPLSVRKAKHGMVSVCIQTEVIYLQAFPSMLILSIHHQLCPGCE